MSESEELVVLKQLFSSLSEEQKTGFPSIGWCTR